MKRWTSVVAAGFLMVITGFAAGGAQAVPPAGQCFAQSRDAALIADRTRILERLGSLRVLNNPNDVAMLAAAGWVPLGHAMVSYRGMGVVFYDLPKSGAAVGSGLQGINISLDNVAEVGEPVALFYQPGPATGDHANPLGGGYPYELAGWAHGANYTPGRFPHTVGLCLDHNDWFVHERGVHVLPSFDMVMQPPVEEIRGADEGRIPLGVPVPFGIPHPRTWVTHVWLDPDGGPPRTAILDPLKEIAGKPGAEHGFFFPGGPVPVDSDGHTH